MTILQFLQILPDPIFNRNPTHNALPPTKPLTLMSCEIPVLPYAVPGPGGVTVLAWGNPAKAQLIGRHYILPGYQVKKPFNGISHRCTVERPDSYTITARFPTPEGGFCRLRFQGPTTGAVWKAVKDEHTKRKGLTAQPNNVSGPEYFGLTLAVVPDILRTLVDSAAPHKPSKRSCLEDSLVCSLPSPKVRRTLPVLGYLRKSIPVLDLEEEDLVSEQAVVAAALDKHWGTATTLPALRTSLASCLAPYGLTAPSAAALQAAAAHRTPLPDWDADTLASEEAVSTAAMDLRWESMTECATCCTGGCISLGALRAAVAVDLQPAGVPSPSAAEVRAVAANKLKLATP